MVMSGCDKRGFRQTAEDKRKQCAVRPKPSAAPHQVRGRLRANDVNITDVFIGCLVLYME